MEIVQPTVKTLNFGCPFIDSYEIFWHP